MNEGKVHGNKIPEQQSMIIILRNKRVIDKIKTETAVMKQNRDEERDYDKK